jgi:hypothetical protein
MCLGLNQYQSPESCADSMDDRIRQTLEALPNSDRAELQKVWLDSFGKGLIAYWEQWKQKL